MKEPDSADAGVNIAEQNRKKLIEEFGSVLDESLIILIANDRDLVKDFSEIRDVLTQLAEPARAEAATGFDPSGLGSLTEHEGLRSDETTASGNGVSGDSLAEYGTTISDFSDQLECLRFTGQTDLDDAQKVQALQLIFSDKFKEHTLKLILKRSGGNLERAFDELLNRQYLEDTGSIPRGIDGFFAVEEGRPLPKGKGGRARKGNAKNMKLAIEYKVVSPSIRNEELEGANDFVQSAGSRAAGSTRCLPPPPPPAPQPALKQTVPYRQPQPAAVTSPVADGFGAANMRAAAALRRLGPLGRQGAVVYTDRAREERRTFAEQASLSADAYVDRQSSESTLDLHGVFVLDGVRIAKQRVWGWWNSLGENRKAAAKQNGFTVITGMGKHSAGGVSRLRQAVGAYLKNDGWKVETLTGSFYITGRV
ncbi:hypothetical protein VTK56DRAFT_6791 [Thermocarpiscus australiensis]